MPEAPEAKENTERQDPTVTANEEAAINQVRQGSAPLNHERLKEQKAGEKDQRHLLLGWTGSQASEEVAKEDGGRRGGTLPGRDPPPRTERLVGEEARREGRDGAREPFNLFIDVLTEHGKKRYPKVSKHKVQSV